MKPLGIGLLGMGNVGSEVARLLVEDSSIFQPRGIQPQLVRVAVKDLTKVRSVRLPTGVLTDDPRRVVEDPEVSMVIELTGLLEEARAWSVAALERGKPVVTANKALMCQHAGELLTMARRKSTHVGYEAAVAAGVPVLRTLREGLAASDILGLTGIVNGTSHYIICRMEQGADYRVALAEAQAKGFAEPDPSLDVDGWDSAYKAAILARVAFGWPTKLEDVARDGISHLAAHDAVLPRDLGLRLKPLVCVWSRPKARLWTAPVLVPSDSPIGRLNLEQSGLDIITGRVGPVMISGRGAGPASTAAAVLADVLELALTGSASAALRETSNVAKPALSAIPGATPEADAARHYVRLAGTPAAAREKVEGAGLTVARLSHAADDVALLLEPGASGLHDGLLRLGPTRASLRVMA